MRYLKLGQHGDDVRALQNKLKVFVPEVEVDGRFGPRKERAVRIAQRRLG
ncbi:peptidoglycan-binding domain-containing protein [Sphingomonas sanguinis]|nr:peptidoglycan-binding domain-containing protein [Sphingomonas sanguinis]